MVTNRNLGGENFRLLPPSGAKTRNVRKIALFRRSRDFSLHGIGRFKSRATPYRIRTVSNFNDQTDKQADRKGGWQQNAVEIRDGVAVGDMHL